MPTKIRSFETRIVVFFVALLAAVQVVAFLVVNAATESISTRELVSQISVGERVFARMLEQNNRQFAQAGAALAADPDFYKAILARNSAAILSALDNHHTHASRDAIMVVDHNNRLLANTLHDHRLDEPFPFPDLIAAAQKTGQASAVVMLDQLGIKLAIDDYGTGYSSLSYVKKLPVIELKIDQSFVRDMTTDADDAMIVKSTIELGHNMGLQVVAEGVEDLAIWALLRQMDCDLAQGYCISKPLPADQFEHWLAANPVFGDPTIPPARLAWRHHPARTTKLQALPRPHTVTSA